jgi:hypothetical protein
MVKSKINSLRVDTSASSLLVTHPSIVLLCRSQLYYFRVFSAANDMFLAIAQLTTDLKAPEADTKQKRYTRVRTFDLRLSHCAMRC